MATLCLEAATWAPSPAEPVHGISHPARITVPDKGIRLDIHSARPVVRPERYPARRAERLRAFALVSSGRASISSSRGSRSGSSVIARKTTPMVTS